MLCSQLTCCNCSTMCLLKLTNKIQRYARCTYHISITALCALARRWINRGKKRPFTSVHYTFKQTIFISPGMWNVLHCSVVPGQCAVVTLQVCVFAIASMCVFVSRSLALSLSRSLALSPSRPLALSHTQTLTLTFPFSFLPLPYPHSIKCSSKRRSQN